MGDDAEQPRHRVLETRGTRGGPARLEEAVAAYRAALQESTRERVPLQWAGTQVKLGNALRVLGECESGTARLEEAVEAYDAALPIFSDAEAVHYATICRANRDRALAILKQKTSAG
jgi:tetratricopeptide (TPR) repeat protein